MYLRVFSMPVLFMYIVYFVYMSVKCGFSMLLLYLSISFMLSEIVLCTIIFVVAMPFLHYIYILCLFLLNEIERSTYHFGTTVFHIFVCWIGFFVCFVLALSLSLNHFLPRNKLDVCAQLPTYTLTICIFTGAHKRISRIALQMNIWNSLSSLSSSALVKFPHFHAHF